MQINQFNKRINNYFDIVTNGTCLILTWHKIDQVENDFTGMSVSQNNFFHQIELLNKKYQVLTIEEFEFITKNKRRFPRKSVLLTFDDGYKDNHTTARPVLESFNKQALFFITTSTIQNQHEFWWDKVQSIIFDSVFTLNSIPLEINNTLKLTEHNLQEIYTQVFQFLVTLPFEKRQDIINEWTINTSHIEHRNNFTVMDWSQLATFKNSPSVVIGAHTHGHARLSSLTYEQQRAEIFTSIQLLQKNLNTSIKHFAFPFGTPNDFNNETLLFCKEADIEYVYAVQKKIVYGKKHYNYFPRFFVHNWTPSIFEEKLKLFNKYF